LHIQFVEVSNFRKLLAVRIDISEEKTLFVGANNSGKTSAMLALRRFLTPRRCPFELFDFTLSHWAPINAIGEAWLKAKAAGETLELTLEPWLDLLPALDLWLHVEPGELHHVRDIIPTLDWAGGRIGVRLRFQPTDLQKLFRDYGQAADAAEELRKAAQAETGDEGPDGGADEKAVAFTVWPTNLSDFLSRQLNSYFAIRTFILDPARLTDPVQSQASPQAIAPETLPLEGDPLKSLILVHDIAAQRGLGEESSGGADEDAPAGSGSSRLSDQLKSYYAKHPDPAKGPDPKDLGALQAIEAAQEAFNLRLSESFADAFKEVEGLGYPGVTDPRPRVTTRIRPMDGLNHSAAVSFLVDVKGEEDEETPILRLPENNNGLGYQNLISMIFRLMSFRDAWMHVGKAQKSPSAQTVEPLHLVLVEEPEAHLHAQVQQVFIRKAYDVLRAHRDLKDSPALKTQLIVSTHSSHVAHEVEFENIRYFRRLPAGMVSKVPVSRVINLCQTFGASEETRRFVMRYLRAQHADLFFADAAILVEGPAERIIVPNFIRRPEYSLLNSAYISLLEINGSHAHRLRPMIECLGLLTLVVTDLDSTDALTGKAAVPQKGGGQKSNNDTLKTWVPALEDVDALMAADATAKVKTEPNDPLFAVRAAYQIPVEVMVPSAATAETAYPYTFEDALVFENLELFAELDGKGLVKKFREAIAAGGGTAVIGKAFYDALAGGGKKAEFALDVIYSDVFDDLKVPTYIAEGFDWLQAELTRKQVEILPAVAAA
jgi:predicted ATP-dependent endonuclease of OLD family